jgi:hypothetical protein
MVGGKTMKLDLQKCGYAAIVAAVSAAFILGSAATGIAKEKKKAEPASKPITCLFTPSSPVCGDKSGERTTYSNACWAEKDGAKVMSDKACPEKKAKAAAAKPAKKKKAM